MNPPRKQFNCRLPVWVCDEIQARAVAMNISQADLITYMMADVKHGVPITIKPQTNEAETKTTSTQIPQVDLSQERSGSA